MCDGIPGSTLLEATVLEEDFFHFVHNGAHLSHGPQTLVSTDQLLGHTGDLDIAEGLELAHLLLSEGCSHMAVFIAGQKSRGLLRSQARMTQVSKLSQMPLATFPRVLASRGATSMRSAHLRRSMWRTGSDRHFHISHSSASL